MPELLKITEKCLNNACIILEHFHSKRMLKMTEKLLKTFLKNAEIVNVISHKTNLQ